MTRTIAVVGTLDTKGPEFAFLKAEIEKRGCRTIVIDAGVLGEPGMVADVRREHVAEAAGARLEDLAARHERGAAVAAMTRGVAEIVRQLHRQGKIDGVISMGGGGGTALGTAAMRALPVGFPKLMVSTIASGDTSPYVGTNDITMMPAVVDVSGINRISRTIFTNAAGAICGMVLGDVAPAGNRPLIAASMFGNTTVAVDHARALLEARGYEVLVFHATGTGGMAMEGLIEAGYFAGVLDLTTTEWADELCGGVLSAGLHRLEAAASAGTPQVVVPGCIDMVNFWAPETVPDRFRERQFYNWNPNVTLMRTTPAENARMGEIFAEKLNAATGPAVVMIPTGGFSQVDLPGQPFYCPEAIQAFTDTLKKRLRPEVPVIEMQTDINDPAFSGKTVEVLLGMLANR